MRHQSTVQLDNQIATAQANHVAAQEKKLEAVRQLALKPSDPEALAKLREADAQAVECDKVVSLLNSAKSRADEIDNEAREDENRREATRALGQAFEAMRKREDAANKLDAVFAELASTVGQWIEVNQEMASAYMQFHRMSGFVTPGPKAPVYQRAAAMGDAANYGNNGLASQMDWATRGLHLREYVAFHYIRHNAHGPEMIVKEVAKHNTRIKSELVGAAARAGIDVVGE